MGKGSRTTKERREHPETAAQPFFLNLSLSNLEGHLARSNRVLLAASEEIQLLLCISTFLLLVASINK